MNTQVVVLGGGCFWCLEAVYLEMDGVDSVQSGYTAGHVKNPSYEAVCGGGTGHAEVVRVAFDADRISFEQILQVFFAIHDPTTLNRQGADVGTQYRSIICYADDAQRAQARAFMNRLQADGVFDAPLVTQLEPLGEYYPAEAYHQRYFEQHPYQGYCMAVVSPKVAKFRKHFSALWRKG